MKGYYVKGLTSGNVMGKGHFPLYFGIPRFESFKKFSDAKRSASLLSRSKNYPEKYTAVEIDVGSNF